MIATVCHFSYDSFSVAECSFWTLFFGQCYVNLCKYHRQTDRQTDRQTHQKYSSEPHNNQQNTSVQELQNLNGTSHK